MEKYSKIVLTDRLYIGSVCDRHKEVPIPGLRIKRDNYCRYCECDNQIRARQKASAQHKRSDYRSTDEAKEYQRQYFKKWRKDNKDRFNELNRKRGYYISKGTLPGYSKINKLVKDNCPEGYVTDHIDPIQADDRCGLNVPWNLQYVPESMNGWKYKYADRVIEEALDPNWKQYL